MLGLRPASRCMLYTRGLQRGHARDKKQEEQGTADDRQGDEVGRSPDSRSRDRGVYASCTEQERLRLRTSLRSTLRSRERERGKFKLGRMCGRVRYQQAHVHISQVSLTEEFLRQRQRSRQFFVQFTVDTNHGKHYLKPELYASACRNAREHATVMTPKMSTACTCCSASAMA